MAKNSRTTAMIIYLIMQKLQTGWQQSVALSQTAIIETAQRCALPKTRSPKASVYLGPNLGVQTRGAASEAWGYGPNLRVCLCFNFY
jgi:hypothetical protein